MKSQDPQFQEKEFKYHKNFLNYFLIFGFLILIVIIILIFVNMQSEGFKCSENPLIYGINSLEKTNNSTLTCNCIESRGALVRRFQLTDDKILKDFENPLDKSMPQSP